MLLLLLLLYSERQLCTSGMMREGDEEWWWWWGGKCDTSDDPPMMIRVLLGLLSGWSSCSFCYSLNRARPRGCPALAGMQRVHAEGRFRS